MLDLPDSMGDGYGMATQSLRRARQRWVKHPEKSNRLRQNSYRPQTQTNPQQNPNNSLEKKKKQLTRMRI